MTYGYFAWRRTPRVAERRADAERRLQAASRRGTAMSPVAIAGRTIARTFWGKAWCDNLERYRDFAYRLERGRSYVRSGAVIDLQIEPGKICAKVSGSSLYSVAIEIDAVAPDAWRAIRRDCAGSIGSRLDLLAGKLSDPVMSRLCADRIGLFPAPSAIRFTCSCPDHAIMCKHVAASMYGVGARLDHAPELLFALRRASVDDLVISALAEVPSGRPAPSRVLAGGGAGGDLAVMFGIELADSAVRPDPAPPPSLTPTAPRPKPRSVAPAPKPGPAPRANAAPRPRPRPRVNATAIPADPRSRARGRPARPALAAPAPPPPARRDRERRTREPRRGALPATGSTRPAASKAGGTMSEQQFERAVGAALRRAARTVRRG